jgi:hypothetical protein
MRFLALTCFLFLSAHAAMARPADDPGVGDAAACLRGIAAAEQTFALPPQLLRSIGIVESGRPDPVTGRVAPWPWTIDVAGAGTMFPTKAAAIAAVQDLQRSGVRSIDVGCVQINLMHHPDAFASLDEAFDPAANTRYGARFLNDLYREIGNWPQAAAAYHSRTADVGMEYEIRVMAVWPLAGRFRDATLLAHGRAALPDPAVANYTPEFAAEVKRMRAEAAQLAAHFGPIHAPLRQPPRPAYATATARPALSGRALADSE